MPSPPAAAVLSTLRVWHVVHAGMLVHAEKPKPETHAEVPAQRKGQRMRAGGGVCR